jgi:hypothetical protein
MPKRALGNGRGDECLFKEFVGGEHNAQRHKQMRHPKNLHTRSGFNSTLLNPINYETVYFTPELFKTGQITSRTVLKRRFCFFFSFLFIFAESLKNNSKSQKYHKIKNPILLDAT